MGVKAGNSVIVKSLIDNAFTEQNINLTVNFVDNSVSLNLLETPILKGYVIDIYADITAKVGSNYLKYTFLEDNVIKIYPAGDTPLSGEKTVNLTFFGMELASTICKGKSIDINEEVQELDTTTFPSTYSTSIKGIKSVTMTLNVLEYNDFILRAIKEDLPVVLTFQEDADATPINYKGVILKESIKSEVNGLIEKTLEFKGERI